MRILILVVLVVLTNNGFMGNWINAYTALFLENAQERKVVEI